MKPNLISGWIDPTDMGLPNGKPIKSSSSDDPSSMDFEGPTSTKRKHDTDTLMEEITTLKENLSSLLQDNYRLNKTNAELQAKCNDYQNVSTYSHQQNAKGDISSQSTTTFETGTKRNLITRIDIFRRNCDIGGGVERQTMTSLSNTDAQQNPNTMCVRQ